MVPSQCLICDHVNPAGAKFCNDCGSRLEVKRCSRCEALNDLAAENCFKCQTEFAAVATPFEAGPVSSAGKTTGASAPVIERLPFRLDFLDQPPKPPPAAREVNAAAQASVAFEPSIATASSPASQLSGPHTAIESDQPEPPRASQPPEELPQPAPSTADATVAAQAPADPERPLATAAAPTPELAWPDAYKPTKRPASRAALAVALPIVALVAIGIYAYYFYDHSFSLSDVPGVRADSATSRAVNSGVPPSRPVQETGVQPPAAPSASSRTGSAAAIGTVKPAPPPEPSTAAATSPVTPEAGNGTRSAAKESRSPDEPQPRTCTEAVAALGLCKLNPEAERK